ncbi:MAG: tRNA uridine-5-carboxymethylaminomethyl(34) synthesis GTPase MnmE [Candidatus Brocadiaceae bacterium]
MSPEIQDTIVAVSAPSGRSFQVIIKISGPEAIPCIQDFFVPAFHGNVSAISTYTSVQGYFYIKEEQTNIPASLYIMKQPFSYTKEDVIEIHTLGSLPVVEMLIRAILSDALNKKRNVRLSQPGEFTKRAFLHGRIDLTQAEAVMRIIHAQTDAELAAAVSQLSGGISRQISHIMDEAVSLCSHIEAAIDFSDQEIELISGEEIMARLKTIVRNISEFLFQSETSRISGEGINTVFYGIPNVGKSSLINALLGKKRSIVSEIPGTTRDVVTDSLHIGGIHFKLTDTAGKDDAQGAVISRTREKTRMALKSAHIVLLVIDGSTNTGEQLKELDLSDAAGRIIVVINKCDVQQKSPIFELPEMLKKYPLVHTSSLTGEGLERLKEMLTENVLGGQINQTSSPSLFNARQREALQRSFLAIQQAQLSTQNNESYEFIALDLRAAINALGEIIGEVTTEDILGKIFSEFCIGK